MKCYKTVITPIPIYEDEIVSVPESSNWFSYVTRALAGHRAQDPDHRIIGSDVGIETSDLYDPEVGSRGIEGWDPGIGVRKDRV